VSTEPTIFRRRRRRRRKRERERERERERGKGREKRRGIERIDASPTPPPPPLWEDWTLCACNLRVIPRRDLSTLDNFHHFHFMAGNRDE
jgi:hypothetical protein